MWSPGWLRQRCGGLAIGVLVTILACAAWDLGWLTPLDQVALDLHFRHAASIPADPRVVLIDIDDAALERVARWPWPRRLLADLVATLADLGARAVALDLVLAEPQPPRWGGLETDADYDLEDALSALDVGTFTYDDEELARALEGAGNAYLAMFCRLVPRAPGLAPAAASADPAALVDQAIAVLRADPNAGAATVYAALDPTAQRRYRPRYEQLRLAAALAERFDLDEPTLALQFGTAVVEAELPAAKQLAAHREARNFFRRTPGGTWRQFLSEVLPGSADGHLTADRADLRLAYRAERAARRALQNAPVTPGALAGIVPRGYDATWPVHRIAGSARGVGLAQAARPAATAVVREVPFAARMEGRLLPLLGFLAAGDMLGIDWSSLRYEHGWLTWKAAAQAGRLPVSDDGQVPINWHRPARAGQWQESFVHLPVTRVLEVALNRRAMQENEDHVELQWARLVERYYADAPAEFVAYGRLLRQRNELRRGLRQASDGAQAADCERELVDVEQSIAEIQAGALEWLTFAWTTQWQPAEPRDVAEEGERAQFEAWYRALAEGAAHGECRQRNAALAARNDELSAALRPAVEGKLCLVGYTASALADMVPTPVCNAMPGVMVHAHMANMMLQQRFMVRAGPAAGVALIALTGLLVTVLTNLRRAGFGLLMLVTVTALVLLLGVERFATRGLYLPSAPAIAGGGVVWATVTVWRQATEERARRALRRALAQYTSPAVAARIAERRDFLDLAPQLTLVTCFLCDLRGFTPLAEHLGPARTRDLLNPFLGTTSSVLTVHGALVNKFLGDGVFAFFNAPIHPCPQHARRACACALAAQAAVENLNAASAERAALPSLTMGVALTTGEAFVGNYGTEAKIDYTCIGDTVNVCSRLEELNALWHTGILTDAATREAAGTAFVFRCAGRVRLRGKTSAVEVYELLGHADRVPENVRAWAERFADAVRCYQHREWERHAALLAECLAFRPDDHVARKYAEHARSMREAGASAAWDGVLPG